MMRSRGFKSALALFCGLLPVAADAGNLIYHNGPVIVSAKVVNIFWGPSFATGGADHAYATTLQAFRNQFGTTGEYNIITQYYQIVGGVQQNIQLANLGSGTADWFDTSTPPTNVTDAIVQAEIQRYLSTHAFNNSTIYQVFLPRTSYSSNGSSTSCGGPGLAYCDYHNYFVNGASSVKYTVQPYPSCSGCKITGFADVGNQEVFVAGTTRDTVTDPLFTGWYDATGFEGQAKCLWSPSPFSDGGFFYPYYWSNAANGCVRVR